MNDKRQVLMDQNKDAIVFESGSMTLRGNEAIKAGTIVSLTQGSVTSECYAHTVTNDFVPYRSYMTSVAFDRATGFSERTQRKDGAYLAE